MKTFLLALAILLTYTLKAQTKGDNTIIVKRVDFDQVVSLLLDKGFAIDKIDKDYKTVKTSFREPNPKYAFSVSYNVRVTKDSTAIISGWVKYSGIEEDIQLGKAPVYKYSFQAMNDFAKSLNNEVVYLKK